MLPLSHPEEPSDSESEYESLEFPEVPSVLLRPTPGATPENAPETVKPATYEHTSPDMPFDSENAGDEKLATSCKIKYYCRGSPTIFTLCFFKVRNRI
ncbi:BnaCnng35760D [Brassica napus]|uniref:BnaCnng35760D protein n=1 Tax=Brassica napus TaxID=3708 RepID=A0A078DXT6_BRANA|nr:BnaCnng35760D [Brassica napus]